MPRSAAPRAYVSAFTLRLGPFSTTGKLVKVTQTGNDDYRRFKMICPDCQDPTEVFQQYVCTVNPSHVHPSSELDRAKDVDGNLVRVSQEEIADARTSDLPVNEFIVTVHPAEEVLNTTWDGDNAYVFLPDRESEEYILLNHLVQNSGQAFIAMCNVRNSEGFYRLAVWRGHLVVQKLYWPDECNQFEAATNECPELLAAAGQSFVDKMTKPFDAEAYKSGVKERLLALEEAAASGTPVPARPEAKKEDGWGSLLNALEAFSS